MADFKGKTFPLLTRLLGFADGQGVSFTTASAAITYTLASPQVNFIDPGGASRDVTFPATRGASVVWVVLNTADAAENLVIKDPAANTLVTVNQNEGGIIATDGTTWDAVAFTIALS